MDNGVGVVQTLGAAMSVLSANTRLHYVFLFYGDEEIGHNWDMWLRYSGAIKYPICYAISIEGLVPHGEKESELCMNREQISGWLHWGFPRLRASGGVGPNTAGDYQNHTATDNLSQCDYSLLKEAQDALLNWIFNIERCLAKPPGRPSMD